jgi:mono/diheme cytochrome c family protein
LEQGHFLPGKKAIMRLRVFCLAAFILFALTSLFTASFTTQTAAPQTNPPQLTPVPAVYTDPSSGQGMFNAYCASCHGRDGKGDGPAALALKRFPSNLTLLAATNGGRFPELQVAQAIKGDWITTAHGSQEMPVWGPVFLYLAHHDPAVAQLRVRNLTKFVESMQQK